MPIDYNHYLKVKDNYCVCYYGVFNEFILQLIYLRPAIEQELPGIQLYISCKDELNYQDSDRIVPQSKLDKHRFAYIKSLQFDNISHPVESFLSESNITLKYLNPPKPIATNKRCVLLTRGLGAVASMSSEQMNAAKRIAESQGYYVEVDERIENAGWVMGVECEALYKAAIDGKRVALVPTGFGTKFFQKIFPNAEILVFKA